MVAGTLSRYFGLRFLTQAVLVFLGILALVALVDYIAVEEADPDRLAQIAEGLRRGAEEAQVEIPGGELAVLPHTAHDITPAAIDTTIEFFQRSLD